MRHRVALVGHADAAPTVRAREVEGVPDDPMHALVGVHFFLHRHFVVGSGLEAAADVDVQPSVFSRNTTKSTSAGVLRLQGTEPLGEQLHRPVVHVQIELETRSEQDVARMRVVRHARVAERPDENRVEVVAQHPVAVGRQRHAGPEVVLRAPGQYLEVERAAEDLADSSQDFDGFRRHVDADAVAGNDGYSHRSIASAMPIPPLTQGSRGRGVRRGARARAAASRQFAPPCSRWDGRERSRRHSR